MFKWGFSPSFANNLIINARSEIITTKYIFKKSFYNKRCLLPATGFFEWKTERNQKIKHKIQLKDQNIFSFAGLYDSFTNEDGQKIPCVTIITTSANSKIETVHNRMPVILKQGIRAKYSPYIFIIFLC